MKKLEDKIIKKVFIFETKKTSFEVLSRAVSVIFLGFLAYIFAEVFIEILREQATLDLLQIFKEDIEVIRRYFFDTILTFYQETPKLIMFLFIFIFILFILLVFWISKNINYLKNRIRAVVRFWLRDGKKS